jgi:UPF0755 protein
LGIRLLLHRISEDTSLKILKKKLLYSLIFFTILVVIAITVFNMLLLPKDCTDNFNVSFTIQQGTTAKQISNALEQKGLIKNSFAFNLYAKMKGLDMKIKSGTYMLKPSMTAKEVLAKMVSGDANNTDIVVTIPEGSTLEQIATILERNDLITKKEFIESAKIENYKIKFDFLEDFPETDLEGLLFPDTYFFVEGKPASFYIEKMLARFYEQYYLKNDFKQKEKLLGIDTYEVVTIASIVEAEAKLQKERPIISSVFYNRLAKGMPLQSCATVMYALNEHKEDLYTEDLQVDSPYNTYINPGLPPGPIGSPGLDSIIAVLNPAKTNYLYFVANGDGSHTFNETFSGHLEAKKRIENRNK